MRIGRLGGTFVGEIIGLDILDEDLERHAEELRRAIDEHGVLVVRDVAQDDDAFVRFSKLFGTLDKEEPGVIGDFGANGELEKAFARTTRMWHSDETYRRPGSKYTILAARVVPPEGGGTEFLDMRAAYEALPDETKAKVDGRLAVHDLACSYAAGGIEIPEADRAAWPPVEQPLVLTHPTAGSRAILTGLHCHYATGMPVDEGRRLVEELDAFADQERFRYVHRHRAGDILMWDNRSVQHRQESWDPQHPRVIRRTTIVDDAVEPVAGKAA